MSVFSPRPTSFLVNTLADVSEWRFFLCVIFTLRPLERKKKEQLIVQFYLTGIDKKSMQSPVKSPEGRGSEVIHFRESRLLLEIKHMFSIFNSLNVAYPTPGIGLWKRTLPISDIYGTVLSFRKGLKSMSSNSQSMISDEVSTVKNKHS